MKKTLALVLISALLAGGCSVRFSAGSDDNNDEIKSSGNILARKCFCGSVILPKGMKLVNVTYKEDSMWLLYRPMRADETEETYTFTEDSRWGLFEGRVEIKETF